MVLCGGCRASYARLDSSSSETVDVNEECLSRGLYVAVIHGEGGRTDYFRGEYIEKRLDGTHKVN